MTSSYNSHSHLHQFSDMNTAKVELTEEMVGRGDWGERPAEPEAFKKLFSYLVKSIDTTVLLPAALSSNLITECQRSECCNEADPYKKAEMFLGYLQRAVNADHRNYHSFVQILKQTKQAKIVSRLRG